MKVTIRKATVAERPGDSRAMFFLELGDTITTVTGPDGRVDLDEPFVAEEPGLYVLQIEQEAA